MVSSPLRARSSVWRAAAATSITSIVTSSVSCIARYARTFLSTSASCARVSSSQNTAGAPVARARRTASCTQSLIGASLVRQARKMSPASTCCSSSAVPLLSTTRMVPAAAASKVLSWLPYSSAFCAMRPTLGTVPMVFGSKAPCSRQCLTVSSYNGAYDESGITNLVSCCWSSAFHIWPEVRMAAGIEASMMMSLGTCRLVMPRLESTIASAGPRSYVGARGRRAEIRLGAPEPRLLPARAYMAAKQPTGAVKSLRAALAIRPDLEAAQRDIAALYVAMGRHEDALREARTVQAQRPQDPLGQVLEAEVYLAQKKVHLAEQTYRRALKKFDRAALAVRTHSILEAAGKSGEADALAEEWIRRHPQDAMMLAYLADRDLAAKRYARAETLYRSALQRVPDHPLLLNNLAWVSQELGRSSALEYAERAHELAPDNPAIMDTLGSILTKSGQVERGLELIGRAADAAPDAYQIRLNFAKSLIKTDRKIAARKELERLPTLDEKLPERQEAVKLLGGL